MRVEPQKVMSEVLQGRFWTPCEMSAKSSGNNRRSAGVLVLAQSHHATSTRSRSREEPAVMPSKRCVDDHGCSVAGMPKLWRIVAECVRHCKSFWPAPGAWGQCVTMGKERPTRRPPFARTNVCKHDASRWLADIRRWYSESKTASMLARQTTDA